MTTEEQLAALEAAHPMGWTHAPREWAPGRLVAQSPVGPLSVVEWRGVWRAECVTELRFPPGHNADDRAIKGLGHSAEEAVSDLRESLDDAIEAYEAATTTLRKLRDAIREGA